MRSLPKIAIAVNVVCILALSACTQQKNTTAAPGPPATAAGANDFVAGINQDLRTKLPYLNSAQWLQATYITDDSQLIGSKANEEFLGYTAQKLQQAKRFNDTKGLSSDTARALMLLKNVGAPPPSSSQLQAELAKILSRMEGNYGAGKWCPTPEDQKNDACLNLTQIEKILKDPAQTPEARAAAWKGWHETARPIRKDYQRFVEIANVGAKEMGFADAGEVWRSG